MEVWNIHGRASDGNQVIQKTTLPAARRPCQDLKEVPAELSSTGLPQQWHKPRARGAKISV